MTAVVVLQIEKSLEEKLEYILPINALVTESDKRMFVWLFDQDTQEVTKRYVKISVPGPEGVYVTDGLAEGDLVISSGASQLREGMKVRLLDEEFR